MGVRTLSWRCWVKRCKKTRETRTAMEDHFFQSHKRTFLKRLKPAERKVYRLLTPAERRGKGKSKGGNRGRSETGVGIEL